MATLLLSATLQIGVIAVVLGVLTIWRTIGTEFFWATAALLGAAIVLTIHALYRFTFLSHKLCWLNCFVSAVILGIAALTLVGLMDRLVGMPLPAKKELMIGTIIVIAVVMLLSWWGIDRFGMEFEQLTDILWVISATLSFGVALVIAWLGRQVTVKMSLQWMMRGIGGTAIVIAIGAVAELGEVNLIALVLITAITLTGTSLYSLHMETVTRTLTAQSS